MEFTREQLVDFVRGLSEPELAASIEEAARQNPNLATQIKALETVSAAATFQKENEVPEMWALRAKALIPLLATSGRRWLAALVFDSRQQPAFGMRSGTSKARDLRFESEWASVDLHVEEGGQTTLTGVVQLNEAGAVPPLRVELWSGEQRMADAETSTHGEFDLEVASFDNLVLSVIDSATGNQVDVDLRSID